MVVFTHLWKSFAVAVTALGLSFSGCKENKASSGDSSGKTVNAEPGAPVGNSAKEAPRAPRPAEHAVFSLNENRLLAHYQENGGLFIPAGSAGFVKYVRFGGKTPPWLSKQEKDGQKTAKMRGKSAALHVPLSASQAEKATSIWIKTHSDAPQRLGLRLNSQKEVTAELIAGWGVAQYALPPGALIAGENEFLFFAGKSAVDVAWLQVGGDAATDEKNTSFDAAKGIWSLPKGSGLAYYVAAPEKGSLVTDVSAGCQLQVSVTPNQGQAKTQTLSGAGAEFALSEYAGQPIRLEMTAAGCDVLSLQNSGLVVPGAMPTFQKAAPPKHIALIIMDSFRADRIKSINPATRVETPFFDELLTKGAVFLQMYVQGNETKCSHASIWTSLYPVNHKMIPPNSSIDPKWVTIEEVAEKAGLFTSGVSGNGYIIPKRGFGDHWKKYRNNIHDGGGLTAANILSKGQESLAGNETKPWFLYLGFIDTHVSWRAKDPWFAKYDPEPYTGRFKREASGEDMGKVAMKQMTINDRDKQRIIALYDSNVSYQDQEIRGFFAKLTEWGIANDTMVFIHADHGDELFEAGRVGHGGASLETLVHTPLILYYPPMVPAGVMFEGAESVDIVPTIADALGVAADPAWQGESLLPLVNGIGRGYPRMSMSSKYENGHAARMGDFKLYVAGARGELFNLKTEPEEKTNVAKENPIAMRMVSDALWMLRAYNSEWKKSTWGNPSNQREAMPASFSE